MVEPRKECFFLIEEGGVKVLFPLTGFTKRVFDMLYGEHRMPPKVSFGLCWAGGAAQPLKVPL